MLRFCGIRIPHFNIHTHTLFLWKTLRLDLALRFPNLFLDTQMLAAAQSPPPPLGQRFGPAHRHLALLRTADWRQSVGTPLPRVNGEAEHQEPVPERASLTF